MSSERIVRNRKQQLFREMVLGTLVYTVIFGFFNDYTNIVHTSSYSITFAAAFVMQLLTYLKFGLKRKVTAWFQQRSGKYNKLWLYASIWFILFLSKFVFLEVIYIVFGGLVEISGFIGLMIAIFSMTIIKELIDYIYNKLAD